MAATRKSPEDSTHTSGFTPEERAAMKDRAKEVRASRGKKKVDGTADLLEKIAAMSDGDRALAERVHAIVTDTAPGLTPRTWYGMPAWAKDGKVVCFFQEAGKFKSRYATFGFQDAASLDTGAMWPVAFALIEMTPAVEKKIGNLVKKAAR